MHRKFERCENTNETPGTQITLPQYTGNLGTSTMNINIPLNLHLQVRKIRNIKVWKSDLLPLIVGEKKIPSVPINAYGAVSELQYFTVRVYLPLVAVRICMFNCSDYHSFLGHFRINHKCQTMTTTKTKTRRLQMRLFSRVDTWDAKPSSIHTLLLRTSYIILDGLPLFPGDPIVSLCRTLHSIGIRSAKPLLRRS